MKPDIVADVLSWNYRGLPQGHFDVVFAAPPCTEYSQAMTGRPRNLEKADAIVRRTLEIIQYLKPKQWFLENPDTGLLKTRGILNHLPSVRVDYCQFSPWGWMKQTRVWGTVEGLPNVVCDGRTCSNMTLQSSAEDQAPRRKHRVLLEGGVVPLVEKYKIPEKLVEYLMRWRSPPSVAELSEDIAEFIKSEPASRRQQNRPPGRSVRSPVKTTHATSSPPVILKPRQLMTAAQLVRLCRARGDAPAEDIQLVLDVLAETSDGRQHRLKALVDTGAQTNCIRAAALPQQYFQPARRPISLSTVSGDVLPGGSREVDIKLFFAPEAPGGRAVGSAWGVDASLYDSATTVDLILCYPWLRQHRLGIMPQKDTLLAEITRGTIYRKSWGQTSSQPDPDDTED